MNYSNRMLVDIVTVVECLPDCLVVHNKAGADIQVKFTASLKLALTSESQECTASASATTEYANMQNAERKTYAENADEPIHFYMNMPHGFCKDIEIPEDARAVSMRVESRWGELMMSVRAGRQYLITKPLFIPKELAETMLLSPRTCRSGDALSTRSESSSEITYKVGIANGTCFGILIFVVLVAFLFDEMMQTLSELGDVSQVAWKSLGQ